MINKWRKKWVQTRSNRVYSACLAEEGETAEGVHWRDQSSQVSRFGELAKIIEPCENLSLLDWGCGYGALFDYLTETRGITSISYTGIDINPKMISACKRRVKDQRATFRIQSHPITPSDYILASGTWNFKMHESRSFWWTQIKAEITNAWMRVNRGMAFNLLSKPPTSKSLFWIEAETLSTFVKKEITGNACIEKIRGLPDTSVRIWK